MNDLLFAHDELSIILRIVVFAQLDNLDHQLEIKVNAYWDAGDEDWTEFELSDMCIN